MTVSSDVNRWAAVGNGATTAFTYTNKILAAGDLKVYVDGVLQTITTHYSVSGVGAEGGGTVTFVTAPANGLAVVIVRDVPYTQSTTMVDGGSFPATLTNAALDKLTILAQQNKDAGARVLRQPDSDAVSLQALPAAAARVSGGVIGFGADPSVPTIITGFVGNPSLPVSAFMGTVLDDTTAAAARTTLGAAAIAANTFTADQTIQSTDAGAGASPSLILDRNSASPAASDLLGALALVGRSSTAVSRTYAQLLAEILDATNTSEDARLLLQTIVAGTLATRVAIGQGIVVGAATGGDQGAGTINAVEVYRNGAALLFSASYDSGDLTITSGGAHTLTHSLGGVPRALFVYLKNVTGEGGYTTNQEVLIQAGENSDNTQARGLSVIQTSTQILLRVGSDANAFLIMAADTGGRVAITNANWKLIIRAYR